MTYILIDASNLFFRAKYVVRGDNMEEKIGMAMHIIFNSINKTWKDFKGSHVVFCFEGSSWRKEFYKPYKAQRREARAALSPQEQADDNEFFAAFNDFQKYITEQTNCTTLQSTNCEADDHIARWIQTHPDDYHVIISSDSDFYQLLSSNISQYNGISKQHITTGGIYDERNDYVIDKKTGEPKMIGDPAWLLFEKCIRGDSSDNIFSAYPGVRKKGSKNAVGLLEAFADRNSKGYNWNNLMLQRWTDHENNEHVVRDDYKRNVALIDLTAQPDHIKEELDAEISRAVTAEPVSQVGLRFMKFCGKNNLIRLGENSAEHARYLGASYVDKNS